MRRRTHRGAGLAVFQVAHLGPMVGQWHWFKNAAPVESAIDIKRYREESLRLLRGQRDILALVESVAVGHHDRAAQAFFPRMDDRVKAFEHPQLTFQSGGK